MLPGNKKLQDLEKRAESLLLDGIREEIETKIREQHKLRKAKDRKISSAGIDAAVPRISGLLTDQIVKGTEVKLLTAPKQVEGEDDRSDEGEELGEQTKQIRKLRKQISATDTKLLTTKYELSYDEAE